ncbi:hypothetical protein T261_0854 [Streptomyces lydicus]|nr:hypothetical protein T261_0854 [Streptomyces lydicus]
MEATTTTDAPTPHDIARALADVIHPDVPTRDVILNLRVRPKADALYGHRASGGPLQMYAQFVHANLYGLPTAPAPVPTALDELLQATRTAQGADQQMAVLAQLAEQLRNAAEIISGPSTRRTGASCPPPSSTG